jgi:hypothetical protein
MSESLDEAHQPGGGGAGNTSSSSSSTSNTHGLLGLQSQIEFLTAENRKWQDLVLKSAQKYQTLQLSKDALHSQLETERKEVERLRAQLNSSPPAQAPTSAATATAAPAPPGGPDSKTTSSSGSSSSNNSATSAATLPASTSDSSSSSVPTHGASSTVSTTPNSVTSLLAERGTREQAWRAERAALKSTHEAAIAELHRTYTTQLDALRLEYTTEREKWDRERDRHRRELDAIRATSEEHKTKLTAQLYKVGMDRLALAQKEQKLNSTCNMSDLLHIVWHRAERSCCVCVRAVRYNSKLTTGTSSA